MGKQTYKVTYEATYWVEAENEDEAIENAIYVHEDLPDGDWNAELHNEHLESPQNQMGVGMWCAQALFLGR